MCFRFKEKSSIKFFMKKIIIEQSKHLKIVSKNYNRYLPLN